MCMRMPVYATIVFWMRSLLSYTTHVWHSGHIRCICKPLLVHVYKHHWPSTIISHYKPLSTNTGSHYWLILINISHYQPLKNHYWSILAIINGIIGIWKSFSQLTKHHHDHHHLPEFWGRTEVPQRWSRCPSRRHQIPCQICGEVKNSISKS